jgi:hypothetical protein
MAYRGKVLKHVEPRHERTMVFQEDGAHPSIEAGLWVADASKPSDELGAVLMVVELVLGQGASHVAAPAAVVCSIPLQCHRTPYASANRLPTCCQDLSRDPLQL